LDRRAKTSNRSGGASPTVMTSRRDDAAEEPTAASDQPTEASAADANGQDRPDQAKANGVPGLPADSIGQARDSAGGAANRTPAAGSPASEGAAATAPASAGPASAGPASAGPASAKGSSKPADSPAGAGSAANGSGSTPRGTGRPSDATSPSTQPVTATSPAASATAPADRGPATAEQAATAVSAASFVWDADEPAPASASSPARNFLRSSVAKASAASKRAVEAVDPAPSSQPGSAGPLPPGPAKRSARQAHLTVARIEPWSVMKFSFVVSLVAFVILFVAVSILYGTLSALGVFDSIQHTVENLTSSTDSSGVNAGNWFTASRVLGYTALLGSLNIVLITAMSTIGAVIYNLTSRLIGGVEVTLRETE
jgi:hypothetical protein